MRVISRARAAVAACLLLLVAGLPAVAGAQPKSPNDLAKEHYDRGQTAYNLGRFDEAIAEFTAAYQITQVPALLFNIAQAQRRKGDNCAAVEVYKNYLMGEPNPPNLADVDGFIKDSDAKCQASRRNPNPDDGARPPDKPPVPDRPKLAAPPTRDAPAVPPTTPESPHPGKGKKRVGVITMGVGAAVLATAGVFGYLSQKQENDIKDLPCFMSPTGCATDEDYRSLDDAGKRYNTLAYVTLGVGAAALVGGGVFYYLGMRADSAAGESISVAPLPGGASVGYAFRF